MEIISAIHFHIPHMIPLRAIIHWKHGNIGKKNSYNDKTPYDSHIHFLPNQKEMAPGWTAKPLGGWRC